MLIIILLYLHCCKFSLLNFFVCRSLLYLYLYVYIYLSLYKYLTGHFYTQLLFLSQSISLLFTISLHQHAWSTIRAISQTSTLVCQNIMFLRNGKNTVYLRLSKPNATFNFSIIKYCRKCMQTIRIIFEKKKNTWKCLSFLKQYCINNYNLWKFLFLRN